eukprot:CAMPEP_0174886616 /NCGR_PEP_ID=MMETSP0167-20121228/1862_1 /TAXON_ID=38298 /ORGANISM="Rhodella maculata, Strain CCMP736" /LENGTH=112 /DNA_ID=CAMNT_0016122717 /DNA_START=77 /DNA_END=411 /DNA_ORIENTATION=+
MAHKSKRHKPFKLPVHSISKDLQESTAPRSKKKKHELLKLPVLSLLLLTSTAPPNPPALHPSSTSSINLLHSTILSLRHAISPTNPSINLLSLSRLRFAARLFRSLRNSSTT